MLPCMCLMPSRVVQWEVFSHSRKEFTVPNSLKLQENPPPPRYNFLALTRPESISFALGQKFYQSLRPVNLSDFFTVLYPCASAEHLPRQWISCFVSDSHSMMTLKTSMRTVPSSPSLRDEDFKCVISSVLLFSRIQHFLGSSCIISLKPNLHREETVLTVTPSHVFLLQNTQTHWT